jgi:hypothetical protein
MVALRLLRGMLYILEWIRVSPGASDLAYIALYEEPQPLDQTDLDEWLLLILKGGGGMIREVAPN